MPKWLKKSLHLLHFLKKSNGISTADSPAQSPKPSDIKQKRA